jgi:hypothetical protein
MLFPGINSKQDEPVQDYKYQGYYQPFHERVL